MDRFLHDGLLKINNDILVMNKENGSYLNLFPENYLFQINDYHISTRPKISKSGFNKAN